MTRELRGLVKGATLALVAAALGSSCVPGYQRNDNSPVNLWVVQMNSGVPLQSDVVSGLNTVEADLIFVDVANRTKNPSVTVPQIPLHIIFERYTVTYTRSDGRNEEGVDVPQRISGALSGEVDVATSGVASLALEVVRIQQKLEPPLRNLRRDVNDPGNTTGGGAIVISVNAEVCIFGRTLAEQVVSDCGSMQIDFGDFSIPNAAS